MSKVMSTLEYAAGAEGFPLPGRNVALDQIPPTGHKIKVDGRYYEVADSITDADTGVTRILVYNAEDPLQRGPAILPRIG